MKKGKIAGRAGPNTHAWDLAQIREHGFAAVLSVNNGDDVHESLLAQLGINYATIPMSANAPVKPGDKEFCLQNIPRALAFIDDNLRLGPVLIHCRSGKDRTGMIMAAWLMTFEGYDPKQAMDEVLAVRPIAFSAEGWMDFSLVVLLAYQAQALTTLAGNKA